MLTSDNRADVSGLRALAHPVRVRLLSMLTARTMSATEAARELGQTQANVSYHMRQLHAVGLLELVEETSVHGGRAKRYRHNPGSGEAMSTGSTDDYVALASVLAEELLRRSLERQPGSRGGFTDAEMWLPAEAWERVLHLASQLGEILHSEARAPGTAGTVHASATLMLFEMAQKDPGA
ncbi:ArsR/SmtB family transcription factor [Actinomadura alba]|uniref:Helix-turn-helix transcriptional regulator n=1 Tax=Actinomadura alba TaxID=406431 RepID=A0ABR7LPG8_9ACTN|nr:helix-turn-helix domain-containing protein [Actinomadura alba]MBC6466748.1 helix-turn-helix transcriptional regulator [Actinomadura alba]